MAYPTLFFSSRVKHVNTVPVLGNYAGILAFSMILAKSNQEEREREMDRTRATLLFMFLCIALFGRGTITQGNQVALSLSTTPHR